MHRRSRAFFAAPVHLPLRERRSLPVIPRICPLHEGDFLGKPISLYWAWNNADGRRRAWKQKVCGDCFRENYASLVVRAMEPVLLCPKCGIGTADDYDAVYLSLFVPGMPSTQSEMPLCPSDAARLRNLALRGATELADRGVGVGGPQPDAQKPVSWEALGLRPQ